MDARITIFTVDYRRSSGPNSAECRSPITETPVISELGVINPRKNGRAIARITNCKRSALRSASSVEPLAFHSAHKELIN